MSATDLKLSIVNAGAIALNIVGIGPYLNVMVSVAAFVYTCQRAWYLYNDRKNKTSNKNQDEN